MLQIVKASAGSGKTFQLVLEYLRLILTTSAGFRHILAVTFTNKATAEMKERILDQLGKIADGEDSKYLQILLATTGYPEFQVREKANSILERLLFDYNSFSVSTIDKFTQRILKAFNREMKINPGFQVETDTELLLSEAVDRLISKADKIPGLLKWMEAFIEDKIRNNKSFSIEKDLNSLGMELFKENLQNRINTLSGFVHDENNARDYLNMLYAIIHRYENRLKEQSKTLVDIYTREGFSSDDFFGKSNGIGATLEKMAKGIPVNNMVDRLEAVMTSMDKWVPSKHRRHEELVTLTGQALMPGLQRLLNYIDTENIKYQTSRVIRSEWFTAALMVDLNGEIAALGREKGILPLSSSNFLLKGVIDGSDTPFVYEKAGNKWHHFMLDEFQDTSELQWENLKPLIGNSLSDDHFSLVVGDVKQSIYRWRNSNWNILEHEVRHDFRNFKIRDIALLSNYRSGRNIIDFNNSFFTLFSLKMAEYQRLDEAPGYRHTLLDIYGDVIQTRTEENVPGGYVSIESIDTEEGDFLENSFSRLVEQIREMYDKGCKAGDMAILVRKNDHGTFIVEHFLGISGRPENQSYNFRIISGESLLLKSSPAVDFVMYLLRYLTNRENRLFKACLLHLYKLYIEISADVPEKNADPENPRSGWFLEQEFEAEFDEIIGRKISDLERKSILSGLDEIIIHTCKLFHLFDIPADLPYLQTLVDKAAELKKTGVNDISGFIRWWDEKGEKVPVNINEEVDAIRLFTIHKAKGLEFKAVFIPFADWTLVDNSNRNILWCKPSVKPFDGAPLVPVKFSTMLADTIFREDYFRELSNVLIDNLNLVYVAFTRAISVLRVNIPSKNKENRMGLYIEQVVRNLSMQVGFENSSDEERNIFSYGILPDFGERKKIEEINAPSGWFFTDFSDKLLLRSDSEDYFDQTEKGYIRKNRGRTLHSILSEIKTDSDVESACNRALASGMLLPVEWQYTREKLSAMVYLPEARDWFTGAWKVYTETDLLTKNDTYRPDRILVRDDQALVVDYKTGDSKQESHVRQVQHYMSILRETGIKEVKGYLWYIQNNELQEV